MNTDWDADPETVARANVDELAKLVICDFIENRHGGRDEWMARAGERYSDHPAAVENLNRAWDRLSARGFLTPYGVRATDVTADGERFIARNCP
jgi:hypothetical protein